MKLRYQGMILLGIPLVCELILLSVLVISLHRIDFAAQKEANAKRIITICQDLRYSLTRYYMLLGAQRFVDTSNMEKRLSSFGDKVDRSMDSLRTAVSGDQESSKIVDKYALSLGRAKVLFADVAGSYEKEGGKNVLARFLTEGEFLEELFDTLRECFQHEEQLIDRYSPLVEEFQPQALQSREKLRFQLVCAGLVNVVVVIGLFLFYLRHTLKRLGLLMNNMSLFSQGRMDLVPIEGKDELAELDQKFRQMAESRMESENMRRQMYAMVSHDLRAPLTSTSLALTMVLDSRDSQLSASQTNKLQKVNSEINRLQRLSSTFLDMEKFEDGKFHLEMSDADVSEIVKTSIGAVFGQSESKKVVIETRVADGIGDIKCDPDRIIQVLVNFLSNAIKFTPRQSTIVVGVELLDGAEKPLMRFSVTDQGKGISEENKSKLFQRYSQLEDSMAGGSGLGLYISRLLIEAHEGRVGADTAAEGGSRFWFDLPC